MLFKEGCACMFKKISLISAVVFSLALVYACGGAVSTAPPKMFPPLFVVAAGLPPPGLMPLPS